MKRMRLLLLVLVLGLASNVRAQQNMQILQNAAAGATGNGTAMNVGDYAGVAVTITIASAWDGTLTFEGSLDNFTTSTSLFATNFVDQSQSATATAAGSWYIPTAGFLQFRARISNRTQGTVTVKARPSAFGLGKAGGLNPGVLPEITAPATPPANKVYLYAKDSGGVSSLFFKKDDGTEVDLAAAGGSGLTSLNGQTGGTQTFTNDTNVTVVSGSNAHVLTWAGQLSVARGGSGAATLTGLLLGNGTSAFTGVTTSAGIRGALSDENGTGAALFSGASAAALTSPDVTTSLTTPSTTFALVNATATTVNAFGATTALNIGAAATLILNFGGSTTAAEFRFLEPSGSGANYSAFKAVAQGANITYSLPPTVGAAGTVLTDVAGNGVLTWAAGGGGSGTVTVVGAGSLTSTALVTGGGTTTVQTPAATATMDSSGNISTPGGFTSGAGGSVAGTLEVGQGTAPSLGTTSVKIYAPASVTSYGIVLPAASATGFVLGTNSSNVNTFSFVGSSGTGNVARVAAPTITSPVINGATNAVIFSSTGYSLTGSNATNGVDIAGTWNTSGAPTALKVNITDTASDNASALVDFQRSGVSIFKVTKSAQVTMEGVSGIGFPTIQFRFDGSALASLQAGSAGTVTLANSGAGNSTGLILSANGTVGSAVAIESGTTWDLVFRPNQVEVMRAKSGGGVSLGLSGTTAGSLIFNNATSGSITLSPVTGALGTPTITVPALTMTMGSRDILQNSQSAAYTTVLADAGKQILHPTADNNARTFTIDSNANVAFPVGTCITFINQINTVTIAIVSDTLVLAGAGTTGSRTLAANGIATAVKITSTIWIINGTGLT